MGLSVWGDRPRIVGLGGRVCQASRWQLMIMLGRPFQVPMMAATAPLCGPSP
jgi:hypothetical protein